MRTSGVSSRQTAALDW